MTEKLSAALDRNHSEQHRSRLYLVIFNRRTIPIPIVVLRPAPH
ncbi:hypothetical protein [Mastigocladopsis repens]|nr:hypothetical protein [Mastigocladopsis repens]